MTKLFFAKTDDHSYAVYYSGMGIVYEIQRSPVWMDKWRAFVFNRGDRERIRFHNDLPDSTQNLGDIKQILEDYWADYDPRSRHLSRGD